MEGQQTLGKHLGYIIRADDCIRPLTTVQIRPRVYQEIKSECCDNCPKLDECELVHWFQYCNKPSCDGCHLNGACFKGCENFKCHKDRTGNCLKEGCPYYNYAGNCIHKPPMNKQPPNMAATCSQELESTLSEVGE